MLTDHELAMLAVVLEVEQGRRPSRTPLPFTQSQGRMKGSFGRGQWFSHFRLGNGGQGIRTAPMGPGGPFPLGELI